ncbi:MAG: OmpA family protein [Blastocatellia bacterium]|nr:OmpA family protein [Blastocatellia bacterium]
MNDPSVHRVADEVSVQSHSLNGAEIETPPASAQLRELQKLLFDTDQQERLEQLHTEWNDPEHLAPRVSQVLPDAISQRSPEDHELTEAMTPYVIESIKISARRNPEHISDAIFPILGPAIRKAIAQAFNNLTITINQTLQHSFSVRGFKWRLEAMASGKSFAEVVLYHSLVYRVEQVLLIHRPSGILLLHAVAEAVKAQDPELVSGMLTAIQDFIQDSFGTGEGNTSSFVSDELTILAEPGPRAVLACVVRGNPPPELREEMQETIERIHQDRGEKLKMFEGDSTPFEVCRPLLEEHLKSRYQPFADPEKQKAPKAMLAVLGVLLLALGIWGFFSLRDRWRWNAYLEKLQTTPGIVVTEQDRGWRRYSLSGLRDSLALDPAKLMPEFQLNPRQLDARWKEYQAPELAEERAKKLLAPPAGVTLKVRDGILSVAGLASQQWISEAKKLAPFIPGISQFQWNDADEIARLRQEIESQSVYYFLNENKPLPGQEETIEALIKRLIRLDEIAQNSNRTITFRIIGHTDSSGTKEKNQTLSRERAQQAKSQLASRVAQLKKVQLVAEGVPDQQPLVGNQESNRRVTFRVELGS